MERAADSDVILGVDPGTRITGFGVIRTNGHHNEALDFGCIRPPSKKSAPERYLIIFNGIEELLQKYKPTAVAVETQFVKKNVQSAIKLGMARGVIILAAARCKIPIYEYAPKKAKLAVAGTGQASKIQVQKMVQRILRLPVLPEPEDASDALALALCHSHERRFAKCMTT
jgi:crossover junction endodeoxyribonuclease RuvC